MKLAFRILLFLIISLSTLHAQTANESHAPTPPMGWNSWDSYGRSINEQQVRATADWMAKNLKKYGWNYVVIDEGWYVLNPKDDPKTYRFALTPDGRYLPDEARYPSARN